jgi:hypothetical protein
MAKTVTPDMVLVDTPREKFVFSIHSLLDFALLVRGDWDHDIRFYYKYFMERWTLESFWF